MSKQANRRLRDFMLINDMSKSKTKLARAEAIRKMRERIEIKQNLPMKDKKLINFIIDDLSTEINDLHIVNDENRYLIDLYRERIDKAIEYINKMCLCTNGYVDCGDDLNPERIVNILRGDE